MSEIVKKNLENNKIQLEKKSIENATQMKIVTMESREWKSKKKKTKDKCPKQRLCRLSLVLCLFIHFSRNEAPTRTDTHKRCAAVCLLLLQMAVQFDSTSNDYTPKWCYNNNNNAILKHNTNYNHIGKYAQELASARAFNSIFNPIAITNHTLNVYIFPFVRWKIVEFEGDRNASDILTA